MMSLKKDHLPIWTKNVFSLYLESRRGSFSVDPYDF